MLELIILYGLALLIFAAVFWAVWRQEGGRSVIFSPFMLFCWYEFAFVWPATVYARATGVSHDSYAALVVFSCTFSFMAAYVFVRQLHGWCHGPAEFCSRPLTSTSAGHRSSLFACSLILCALGFYLFQGVPPAILALFEVLQSGFSLDISASMSEARFLLTKGHHFGEAYRGQGAIRLLMAAAWPFLTAVAFLLYRARRSRAWGYGFCVLVLMCLVFVGGDGTRAPFLLSMVAVFVSASFAVVIRTRTCVGFAVIILAMLVGLSLTKKLATVYGEDNAVAAGGQQLAERVFLLNGAQTVEVIELVREDVIDLRHGGVHMTDVRNSLPFVHGGQPFSLELFFLQNPDASYTKTTFSTMTWLGKLYADFGWLGCVLGYGLMGGLVALISQRLFRSRRTVLNTAVVGMLSFKLGQLNLFGPVHCAWWIAVLLGVVCGYRVLLFAGEFRVKANQLAWSSTHGRRI